MFNLGKYVHISTYSIRRERFAMHLEGIIALCFIANNGVVFFKACFTVSFLANLVPWHRLATVVRYQGN